MKSGVGSREAVHRLWKIVKIVIIERLTRKPHTKRPSISQPKLLEWVECMDPEVEL